MKLYGVLGPTLSFGPHVGIRKGRNCGQADIFAGARLSVGGEAKIFGYGVRYDVPAWESQRVLSQISYGSNGVDISHGRPTGLRVADTGIDSVTLEWNAPQNDCGLAGYNVYRAGWLIAKGVVGTTYTDGGLVPERQYCYEVSAKRRAGGETASTGEMCDSTEGLETELPETPVNVAAKALSSSAISVTWDAPTDAGGITGYVVYQHSGPDAFPVDSVSVATPAVEVGGLQPDSEYCFSVGSVSAAGSSDRSNRICVSTLRAQQGNGQEPGPGPGEDKLPGLGGGGTDMRPYYFCQYHHDSPNPKWTPSKEGSYPEAIVYRCDYGTYTRDPLECRYTADEDAWQYYESGSWGGYFSCDTAEKASVAIRRACNAIGVGRTLNDGVWEKTTGCEVVRSWGDRYCGRNTIRERDGGRDVDFECGGVPPPTEPPPLSGGSVSVLSEPYWVCHCGDETGFLPRAEGIPRWEYNPDEGYTQLCRCGSEVYNPTDCRGRDKQRTRPLQGWLCGEDDDLRLSCADMSYRSSISGVLESEEDIDLPSYQRRYVSGDYTRFPGCTNTNDYRDSCGFEESDGGCVRSPQGRLFE